MLPFRIVQDPPACTVYSLRCVLLITSGRVITNAGRVEWAYTHRYPGLFRLAEQP